MYKLIYEQFSYVYFKVEFLLYGTNAKKNTEGMIITQTLCYKYSFTFCVTK